MKSLGVKLNYSTAYHPQTDGQTERVNQCLENFLRCMVFDKQNKWNQWLYLAEHWYNTSYHSSLKCSPFKALYGYESRELPLATNNTTGNALSAREEVRRSHTVITIRENLEKAQKRMKKNADKHRSERQFKVGDWVYMKLQPYRQVTVAGHIHSKLNPKYYGPYEIIEKIGTIAYKLNLPEGSSIHPVIHVSQLKLKHGEGVKVDTQLPVVGPDGELRVEPLKILDRRVIRRRNEAVAQLLIQWFNRPEGDAIWEDYTTIASNYPNFILEGKNDLKGKGVSTMKAGISSPNRLLAVAGEFDLVKLEGGEREEEDNGKEDGTVRDCSAVGGVGDINRGSVTLR